MSVAALDPTNYYFDLAFLVPSSFLLYFYDWTTRNSMQDLNKVLQGEKRKLVGRKFPFTFDAGLLVTTTSIRRLRFCFADDAAAAACVRITIAITAGAFIVTILVQAIVELIFLV